MSNFRVTVETARVGQRVNHESGFAEGKIIHVDKLLRVKLPSTAVMSEPIDRWLHVIPPRPDFGCGPAGGSAFEEQKQREWDELYGHLPGARDAGTVSLLGQVTPARPHLIDGEFQSDKYPTCPRGKVPLSTKDPTAQDLLWTYAQRRRDVDAEFSDDLETALRLKGYEPSAPGMLSAEPPRCPDCGRVGQYIPARGAWYCSEDRPSECRRSGPIPIEPGTSRPELPPAAHAPLDLAALRALAREAKERAAPPARHPEERRPLNREAFARLIEEDVAWVQAQPRALESDHVIAVLRWSVTTLAAQVRAETIALATAVEQLADAYEAERTGRVLAEAAASTLADERAKDEAAYSNLCTRAANLERLIERMDAECRRMRPLVEAAERWYRYGNEHELKAAVENYRAATKGASS